MIDTTEERLIMSSAVERGFALIVDDDSYLCKTLAEVVAARFSRVDTVGSVAELRAAIARQKYDFVILDFKLPDGTGLDVLNLLAPSGQYPAVVAVSGDVAPEDTFELAQKGVRAFLKKPFGLSDVRAAVERALSEPPDLTPSVLNSLGKRPLHEIEASVRRAMVSEALSRSGGNVSAAASLLGISRQLLNHIRRRGHDS